MLKEISKKQLTELKKILDQVKDSDYSKTIDVLENGTLGRHVRHILEFYECLFISNEGDTICYDDRKRNLLLEGNVRFACDYIDEISDQIDKIEINKRLLLKSKYEGSEVIMETSLFREITYNIEHTVHHLAIIRIAISSELKYIDLSQTFGFADSTVQFLKSQTVSV
ncbi:MAG: DinB family protein [Bacteroidetes bacterium]|nr:DinB family protein [Bacteroidota bacterium]